MNYGVNSLKLTTSSEYHTSIASILFEVKHWSIREKSKQYFLLNHQVIIIYPAKKSVALLLSITTPPPSGRAKLF